MVLTVLIPHALQVARGMMNDDHENEKNGGSIGGMCLNNKYLLPPPFFVTKSCIRIFMQSSFRMMKIKLGEPRSQFDISMW
jgi:hypothetical protein